MEAFWGLGEARRNSPQIPRRFAYIHDDKTLLERVGKFRHRLTHWILLNSLKSEDIHFLFLSRASASHQTYYRSFGWATAAGVLLSFASLQAFLWNPAVLRRTHVRSGSILTRLALDIALIAFGNTRLVCFLPHFCLAFSFSPAPAPAPAAFAASSPKIFDAAMNLNVETKC